MRIGSDRDGFDRCDVLKQQRRPTPDDFSQTDPTRAPTAVQIGPCLVLGNSVADWIAEIRKMWAQGAANTLELARLMCGIHEQLPRGQWTSLWRSGQMPFAERKGYMLLVIGDGLGWANLQTVAGLPMGWSILYHLARLERMTLERLIQEGVIHPALTQREARQLAARFRGATLKTRSARAVLRERLRRFAKFVAHHLADWSADERELAKEQLTQLIEQIGIADGFGTNGHSRSCLTRCNSLTD